MKHHHNLIHLLLPIIAVLLLLTWRIAHAKDWQEWDVYTTDAPEAARLEPTGRDLTWSTAEGKGDTRLFFSNHPETLEQPYNTANPQDPRWPGVNMESKLWCDEGQGADEVKYQVFITHISAFDKPFFIGVVIENLSSDTPLEVTGEYVSAIGKPSNDPITGWNNMKTVGKRCSYADLSNTLLTKLPDTKLPAAKPGEHRETRLLYWKVDYGCTLGAHLHLRVRKTSGTGPVRCRLSTAWAWTPEKLATNLALIPLNGPHARGSWAVAESVLSNKDDVYDIGANERGAENVRWLRICQPRYDAAGKKVGYANDVILTKELSFNPEQARMDSGMYGARINAQLHVKNSGATEETLGLYLRYVDKRLEGVYAGAATTYRYDDAKQAWLPDQTRAVDLSNLTFRDAQGQLIQPKWLATQCLASYTVKPGEQRTIPLTLMNDGPSMLPLAIVLRKMAK